MCRSIWYGQLSGMVEPIFGILGAVAVTVASIILPYALSFAAGAMIYIVADDILPEAHTRYFIWKFIVDLFLSSIFLIIFSPRVVETECLQHGVPLSVLL